jgi:hypothetical protein
VPPDCPVCQRSNDLRAQRSTPMVACKREQCADSSRRVRAAPECAPDSEQCMFGVARDCPVPQEVRAPTIKIVRTLTVGRHGWCTGQCPVAHRTVRCAHRQTASPTAMWWLRAINTPQPPPLQVSKFFRHLIQYKS